MARPSRVNDPVHVGVGSVWIPKYPRPGKPAALTVAACVDRPNGANFVVDSAGRGPHLISYKYLVGEYKLEQAAVD